VDADLSGYFDSIPHAELMKSAWRVAWSTGTSCCLIKAMAGGAGGRRRRSWAPARRDSMANRDNKRGTPQGAPISPLLSNLYMRRFILGWKHWAVSNAWAATDRQLRDDFVICCKARGRQALEATRKIMGRLKLTVNDEKTHLCRIPQERFDFLGLHLWAMLSPTMGEPIWHQAVEEEHQANGGKYQLRDRSPPYRAGCRKDCGALNRKLNGWANYFCLGPVSAAYRTINTHARIGFAGGCARNTRFKEWVVTIPESVPP
jgi:RNA-directed DNA polymerase